MLAATLFAASPAVDTPTAPNAVATAQRGLDAVALGLRALGQHDTGDDICDAPPPRGGSLATTATLMGCVAETVGEGATQAAGLATALQGLVVLGASVPLIVGEATPEPETALASPLR